MHMAKAPEVGNRRVFSEMQRKTMESMMERKELTAKCTETDDE